MVSRPSVHFVAYDWPDRDGQGHASPARTKATVRDVLQAAPSASLSAAKLALGLPFRGRHQVKHTTWPSAAVRRAFK